MADTFTCPQGHESHDPEWCDICGDRIGAAPPAAPPAAEPPPLAGEPPVAAGGPTATCPNCQAVNDADNLFCEECGYDFTTGQVPAPPAVPAPAPQAPVGGPAWVVVVEVDPAWYDLKGSLADTPCPPANTSTVPLHGRTTSIGRTSSSKGIRPDIALDQDTGVSRRHAQLINDGSSLTIVDLASTNGTYVVPAGSEPDASIEPLAADDAHPLHDGDRVYVGAWTRLTVRTG